MSNSFKPNYWGRLSQFEIPHSIVQGNRVALKPSALSVLLVLFEIGKSKRSRVVGSSVDVKASQELLMERSGSSKNMITGAVEELEQKRFIRRSSSRKKYGEFGANLYTLCDPATGGALVTAKTQNFLIANEVQYIKIPKCVVKEHQADWSLARMSGSEKRMYVAICWLANRKNSNEFQFDVADLKKLADFSTLGTAEKALEGLLDKSLVSVLSDEITLHDPYTGEALHVEDGNPSADPANYYRIREKGRATRMNWNTGPEQVQKLLEDCGLEPVEKDNGELAILCPFHTDQNPSCLVNPKKRVFYCFGCEARGTLMQFIMRLRSVGRDTALKIMAESAGQAVEFHEPDKNAEAIYSYYNADGVLKKEVLRYPGKQFSQRRPAPSGGWIWNTDDVKPLLYDAYLVKYATVVCICEGEKHRESLEEIQTVRFDWRGVRGDDIRKRR